MFDVNSPVSLPEWQQWHSLCSLEPRLLELLAEACAFQSDRRKSFCANEVWYGEGKYKGKGLKQRMARLVGQAAGYPEPVPNTLGIGKETGGHFPDPICLADLPVREMEPRRPEFPAELGTSRAYDVAYKVIYCALPDCRECGCAQRGNLRR